LQPGHMGDHVGLGRHVKLFRGRIVQRKYCHTILIATAAAPLSLLGPALAGREIEPVFVMLL
jgi:hypothetical protein